VLIHARFPRRQIWCYLKLRVEARPISTLSSITRPALPCSCRIIVLSPSPRLPPIMRILWRTCVLPAEADLVLNSASRRPLNWKHTALYFKIKVSTIRSDSDSKYSIHPGSETPTWQRASFYTRRPSAMSCFIEVPYSLSAQPPSSLQTFFSTYSKCSPKRCATCHLLTLLISDNSISVLLHQRSRQNSNVSARNPFRIRDRWSRESYR
jgi:hypothetical protein